MNPFASGPAGAIRVQLVTRGGQVAAARLSSSRPTDLAQRLFAGRPPEHVLSTLPMVFSVCATAQASAAAQAIECAGGIRVDPAHRTARELLVLAETAREHLFRILLGWSDWLGTAPPTGGLGMLGRMRTSLALALYPQGDAFHAGGGNLVADRGTLAGLVDELDGLAASALDGNADDWLQRWSVGADPDALTRWARDGQSVAQRLLAELIGRGHEGLGRSTVALLPQIAPADLQRSLAGDSADAFVRTPVWDGMPRETGALQRGAGAPLVAACEAIYGNGLLTRLVARLQELATVITQMRARLAALTPAAAGRPSVVTDGTAVGVVEAARGRLVHWVRLAGGLVGGYRILAPTEWNFHPQGALARGLMTLPAADELPRLARLLVEAIDPCVESRIEVTADA